MSARTHVPAKIRREPLERSNRHRLKLGPQQACVLAKALVLAHAPAHAGKRTAFQYGFEGPREIRYRQIIDETPDVNVKGARLHALRVYTTQTSQGFLLRLLRREPAIHLVATTYSLQAIEQRLS